MISEPAARGRADEGTRRQLSARDRIWGLLALLGVVALLIYLRDPTEPSPGISLALPPNSPLPAEWTESAPSSPAWSLALDDYGNGRYEEAADRFAAIAAAEGDRPDLARLFLGSCHLLLGRDEKAELSLRLAARAGAPPTTDEARWLLAVLLLRRDESEAARPELEKLIDSGGPREGMARTLLDQLGTPVPPR